MLLARNMKGIYRYCEHAVNTCLPPSSTALNISELSALLTMMVCHGEVFFIKIDPKQKAFHHWHDRRCSNLFNLTSVYILPQAFSEVVFNFTIYSDFLNKNVSSFVLGSPYLFSEQVLCVMGSVGSI